MTANERPRYRKLPGSRRGVLKGSSVWLGTDHLLLVRSWRSREEYKRFHMSDIQAISLAKAPRFHLSTRSMAFATLWLIAFAIAGALNSAWASITLAFIAFALVGAWIYVSAKCSCRCRLYTAVSGDELPSIYRTWTARKFMARVEPHIAAAQGTLESEWPEAVDARRIGPPENEPDRSVLGLQTGMPTVPQGAHPIPNSSLRLAQLFVASMFVDAAYSFATANHASPVVTWVGYGIIALELALSLALIIRQIKDSWPWMQRLVIASIMVTGLIWYGQPLFNAAAAISRVATGKARVAPSTTVPGAGSNKGLQYFDIGSHLALGIAGVALIFARREKHRRFPGQ